ncbi:MAG TPA: sigma-70 family RNA polymerase sigma factor [Chitinophagaceae bacterium]|jgi:RNA polymerase sigma-70 factor (ECF subfamily)|nr:sigma-70 family RNA polymerase sigma factor [Chitinophagaceae bacterium]
MINYDYRTILQFISENSPKGLELLYLRYGKPFYSFALERWKFSEDEATEIVYKTLETLVLKLPNYEFGSQALFDGFLFKVFINFLKQKYRENRKRQLPQLEFFDLEQEFELPSNVQKALNRQSFSEYYYSDKLESPAMKILKTSLEQLEQMDRDILLLRAQNYSYEEIAGMLGIENKQLKVRHHRAKQKLINLLNEANI